ncbi:MAG TPA: FAD-dependent oxidoreductase [Candidatus Limnocylindria bacterium]|nr:FAD-dependent oxidoreductase [Candidatus Limnocylindria bacterium]
MARRTFVIIGAGLAGAEAAVQLRKDGFDGRVILVGDEASQPYERPPLSKAYLRGAAERPTLDVRSASYYLDHAVELLLSTRATAIEPRRRVVVLDGARRLRYDRLLLTPGAAARRLELPGSNLAGIHVLRTVEDADAIRAAASRADRAVVIGGGWIGAEVTASLRQLGLPVAMVAPGSAPLERVLGPEVGAVYRDLHAEHGVELVLGSRVGTFHGHGAVEAVETVDGRRIGGDLVVVGAGAVPQTSLAEAAGLEVGDGIHVNEHLETGTAGIFAAGDVAAAWHPVLGERIRVEHWDNARRQGRAAARGMLGTSEPYARIPYFYSDQYDLGMEYAGHARSWDRVVFRGDIATRAFIAFWLLEGRVVAAMNANMGPVNASLATLVASRNQVTADRLLDPQVPLDEIVSPGSEPMVAAQHVSR